MRCSSTVEGIQKCKTGTDWPYISFSDSLSCSCRLTNNISVRFKSESYSCQHHTGAGGERKQDINRIVAKCQYTLLLLIFLETWNIHSVEPISCDFVKVFEILNGDEMQNSDEGRKRRNVMTTIKVFLGLFKENSPWPSWSRSFIIESV